MPRTSDARAKALQTAERLFRVQGYAATGLTQILDESGAPKGSFYHHFPGGKAQMAEEALVAYVDRGLRVIAFARQSSDKDGLRFVAILCGAFADELEKSGWTLGCLLQNLGAEMAPGDHAWTDRLHAAANVWIAAIADALRDIHDAPGDPGSVAIALLAALEGARTLARLQRSRAALESVAAAFAAMLSRPVPPRP